MIRKAVPVLVHEDCMGSISEGLDGIATDVEDINMNTASIKTSSANAATQLGNIKEDTGSLMSSVGLPADEASANTVIGLLKSISDKITTF